MKLSKKNLIYSLSMALLLMCLIIGYFIFMLPSLYVDYMQHSNLNSIKKQHLSYLITRSYQDISVNNPAGCFTIDIPLEQECIYFTNKAMRARIDAKDQNTKQLLADIKSIVSDIRSDSNVIHDENWQSNIETQINQWKNSFAQYDTLSEDFPFSLSVLESRDYSELFSPATSTTHLISDDTMILESGVHDQKNSFTNYFAATIRDDHLIISYLPVVTPKMNEILPVVLQSVPMIATVLLLIVLLFSQFYSRGIVTPIVTLVRHTKTVQLSGIKNAHVPEIKGCEEVSNLGATLNDLYEQLRSSYAQLEEKNQELADENEQKEVFLRSSSHQLKTPIAAALLLLDGMIAQIGKYKDTAVYLPEVKQQLLSMKKIVDDILYLNHCGDNLSFEPLDLAAILQSLLSAYHIEITEKKLDIQSQELPSIQIQTDYNLFTKILDNLIANAVAYTPVGNEISLSVDRSSNDLILINYGISIRDDLLPNIFEPFVSGNPDNRCHGLGLYIVDYYAKKLDIQVSIKNVTIDERIGVCTTVHFKCEL